jgi:hypothetical protein
MVEHAYHVDCLAVGCNDGEVGLSVLVLSQEI